jgi:hypothetical protein
MTRNLQIVPATEALAERMAPRLRAADTAEVLAGNGLTPLEALLRSVRSSVEARVWMVDGEPAAMWGVEPVSVEARIGIAWLLGTDLIERHPVPFWMLCKREIARMLERWRVLLNWIALDYARSLNWARALGFSVDAPRPFGAAGALFCCAALVRPAGGA